MGFVRSRVFPIGAHTRGTRSFAIVASICTNNRSSSSRSSCPSNLFVVLLRAHIPLVLELFPLPSWIHFVLNSFKIRLERILLYNNHEIQTTIRTKNEDTRPQQANDACCRFRGITNKLSPQSSPRIGRSLADSIGGSRVGEDNCQHCNSLSKCIVQQKTPTGHCCQEWATKATLAGFSRRNRNQPLARL